MRKLSFILLLFIGLLYNNCHINAQTIQKGNVQEYRGELKKSPLPGVEMYVKNANSTVSDKKGNFKLEFHTLKPGEKVNPRRIEKLGYEIFNKEALEQWNINPEEPFIIVMVRSDLFKELRDMYSRVSYESYEKQYNQERAKLKAELDAGRITEDELRNQIATLREEYDRQLENLDNYIDRFARIDLSEISETEQEIVKLVQEGLLEEAISKYEEMNLIAKYEQQSKDIEELNKAKTALDKRISEKELSLKTLFSQIGRQLDTYMIAGGVESYEKILNITNRIIQDPSSDLWMKLGLIKYLKNNDIISIYESIDFSEFKNESEEMLAREGYALSLYFCGNYEKALEQATFVVNIATRLNEYEYIVRGKGLMADIYATLFDNDKALEIYDELLGYLDDANISSELNLETKAEIYNSLGNHYQNIDINTFYEYQTKSNAIYQQMYHDSPTYFNEKKYMYSQVSYALALRVVGDYDKSIDILQDALPYFETKYKEEIIKISALSYSTICKTLADNYFFIKKYDLSEAMYFRALKIASELEQHNYDDLDEKEVSGLYNNLGYLYFTCEEFDKSESAYKKSIEIIEPYHYNAPNLYSILAIFRPMINISSLYLRLSKYELAREYGYKGLANCEILYNNFPDNFISEYVLVLKNLAVAELELEQYETALSLIDKAITAETSNDNFEDAELYEIKERIISLTNK